MKLKAFIFFILAAAIGSCGKYCDLSTAEGAAACTCKLLKEFDEAKGDEEKTKEIAAKYDQFEKEFDKNISEGLYTEKEVNDLIKKMNNCK